ncbi:MAG: hypothetical protein AAF664_04290 [Planctomycetota bacterium]
MKRFTSLACVLLLASANPIHANVTIDVDLLANGDGRFSEPESDAFAIIDPALNTQSSDTRNGFYGISDPSVTFGQPVFTFNNGDWSDVGSITLDGTPTGVGSENFNITDALFDFNQYIEGGKLSRVASSTNNNGNYLTNLSNISGSVSFSQGLVSNINLTSDIEFEFVNTGSYTGSLSISNNGFDLFADGTLGSGFFATTNIWDFDGVTSSSFVVTAVPEPTMGCFLLGLAGLASFKRRRSIRG